MRVTWSDDIESALENLGGKAHRSDILREVRKIRSRAGRSVPESIEETVQGALQREERFVMVSKGSGWYRLAPQTKLTLDDF